MYILTRLIVETGAVQLALEQLQPDDGIDDDDKYHKQRNVKQRHHGSQNGVEDHLQTCERETKRSELRTTRSSVSRRQAVRGYNNWGL